jgi:hypothetical protein
MPYPSTAKGKMKNIMATTANHIRNFSNLLIGSG